MDTDQRGTKMTSYQLYQHYKTKKYYRIINEIHNEETEKVFVSYQCVNDQNAKIWFQPKDRFFGLTEDETKRFTLCYPREVKSYNCVSDRLIEQFDKLEQEPGLEEYTKGLGLHVIKANKK